MKKVLSIALALALVLSVMSVSVFAADNGTHPTVKDGSVHNGDAGSYWLVGQQGNSDSIDNGKTKDDFTPGKADSYITINFNKKDEGNTDIPGADDGDNIGGGDAIEDRYAIDIEYWDLVIDLTDIPNVVLTTDKDGDGEVDVGDTVTIVTKVWNVNAHRYDNKEEEKSVETDEEAENLNEGLTDDTDAAPITIDAFQVTNHSSLSIWYHSELQTLAKADEALNLKLDQDKVLLEVTRATAPVDGAETGTATHGSVHKLTAEPAATWVEAINALAGNNYVTGSIIGSITVKFAKESDSASEGFDNLLPPSLEEPKDTSNITVD